MDVARGSTPSGPASLYWFFCRSAGLGLGLGNEFGTALVLALGFPAGLVLLIVDMKAHA